MKKFKDFIHEAKADDVALRFGSKNKPNHISKRKKWDVEINIDNIDGKKSKIPPMTNLKGIIKQVEEYLKKKDTKRIIMYDLSGASSYPPMFDSNKDKIQKLYDILKSNESLTPVNESEDEWDEKISRSNEDILEKIISLKSDLEDDLYKLKNRIAYGGNYGETIRHSKSIIKICKEMASLCKNIKEPYKRK